MSLAALPTLGNFTRTGSFYHCFFFSSRTKLKKGRTKMNAKKRLLVLLVAIMILSLATTSTFADSDSNEVPSDATVYGAGTCHYGFTTSRTISRGSG